MACDFGWIVEYVVGDGEGFFSVSSLLSLRHVLLNPACGVILVRVSLIDQL